MESELMLSGKMVRIINDIQYYKEQIELCQFVIKNKKADIINTENEIERLKEEYGIENAIERKRVETDNNAGIAERKRRQA